MSKRTHRDPVSGVSAVRIGGLPLYFLFGLVISIVVVAALLGIFIDFAGDDTGDTPLLATVTRGLFQYVVVEDGEVESSNNVEVRCEIRVRASGGPPGPSTTILDAIPEGSLVQEGDWLVTLDSSGLEQEKRAEQITLNTFEANMIEAKASYDIALITKEEFLSGGLARISINLAANDRRVRGSSLSSASGPPQSRAAASGSPPPSGRSSAQSNPPAQTSNPPAQTSNPPAQTSNPPAQTSSRPTRSRSVARGDPAEEGPVPLVDPSYGVLKRFIENEISVAGESQRKAQLSFDSMKRIVARGLVAKSQLEGERFRVLAAQNVTDLAKQKLAVLENYTKRKMLVQLESSFQVAEVRYQSELRTYEEQLAKVKEIDDQIAKCRVVAPVAGQVVHKNVQSGRAGSEFVVEPGAPVRENQVIIMLPDPTQMQVKTGVDESQINLVQEGMPVSVRVHAFGSIHQGRVTKVNTYAESTNFFNSSMTKQYLTLIRLLDLPPNIRAGLTAEVTILVEERSDALQMPFQPVYEQGGKKFCLVKKGDRWETREIVISSTNEKMVVLDEQASESLRVGDQVAMNPKRHLDLFDHSRFPREEPQKIEKKASRGAAEATEQPGA
jgi:hypothetical protein